MATERLQKILARGGFASRRAAEKLIAEGRVRVNGRVVTQLGTQADPRNDKVEVDGTRVVKEQTVYAVLHKPRGVVTTMNDPEGRASVKELLGAIGARAYPVGRLDFATSGVLLVTNDGDFAEGLMHPKKAVPKTYVVKVHGVMEAADLDRWRNGVRLEDGMTLPAQAKMIRYEGDKTWFELTIREGRNQQIRRMGEATQFPVMRLARLSFAGVSSEGLKPGEWRHLTRDELMTLKKEYGVPKRIVTPEEPEARGRGRTKQGHAGKHVARPGERGERGERGRRPGPGDAHARGPRREGERSGAPPRGDRGERPNRGVRGDRGAPAERGERGLRAERGERGPRAERGDRGAPAERGERRPRVERGDRGAPAGRSARAERGPRAERGDRGAPAERSVRAERGPRAERGERGDRGVRADRGERGERPDAARGRADDRRSRAAVQRGEKVQRGGRRAGRTGRAPAPAEADRGGRSSGPPRESAGREPAKGAREDKGARYGGGSPGRRGYDVKEDWGGGAGRGRTSSDRGGQSEGREGGREGREGQPGRGSSGGWHSRTTGTGGGPGASGGDYRMRGGRRGR